jgi:TetR/AcrR family transcriptional repressor of nem operon
MNVGYLCVIMINPSNVSSNKEKIIDLSRNIIQRVGYHSFNYKQIADMIGIKNSSIHHYFAAKEDLGVAVIEKDNADFHSKVIAWNSYAPIERIDFLLDLYKHYFSEGKLCIIGTFGSSYQDIPEKVQNAVSAYMDKIAMWLTQTLKEGLLTGDFKFKTSPEALTAAWLSALTGSLQMGRLRGDAQFQQTLAHLRESLK